MYRQHQYFLQNNLFNSKAQTGNYISFKQTARQQHPQKVYTNQISKNHINFVKSAVRELSRSRSPLFQHKSQYFVKQERQVPKKQKNLQFQNETMNRPNRKRNKIFQSNYFSKSKRSLDKQSSRLKQNHSPYQQLLRATSTSNFHLREQKLQKIGSYTGFQARNSMVNKVNPKITFTYGNIPKPNSNLVVYKDQVRTYFSKVMTESSKEDKINPIIHKIKKPNPTYRKGTLIDQIKIEDPVIIHSEDSKISLANRIAWDALDTDKLRLPDGFSNIEEDNSSQRYFDGEQGEALLGKPVSYKNIDILQGQYAEAEQHNPHNIFSDFDQSRRLQRSQPPKNDNQHIPLEVLEQSTYNIKKEIKQKNQDNWIPPLLVMLAAFLLLLQLFA